MTTLIKLREAYEDQIRAKMKRRPPRSNFVTQVRKASRGVIPRGPRYRQLVLQYKGLDKYGKWVPALDPRPREHARASGFLDFQQIGRTLRTPGKVTVYPDSYAQHLDRLPEKARQRILEDAGTDLATYSAGSADLGKSEILAVAKQFRDEATAELLRARAWSPTGRIVGKSPLLAAPFGPADGEEWGSERYKKD